MYDVAVSSPILNTFATFPRASWLLAVSVLEAIFSRVPVGRAQNMSIPTVQYLRT